MLAKEFGANGWAIERDVFMALEESADREVDGTNVIGLSETDMLALMRRWVTEEHPGITVGLDQVEEYHRREGRFWEERSFGVLGSDGTPAAITKLRYNGTTAWVEDVYTVPEARGRGYARTLVTHAAELAISEGHDLTFIIADDDDWPKHLYEKVGFRPIGRTRTFHRELGLSA